MSMHILPIKAIANISTDKLREIVSQLQEKSKNTQHLYNILDSQFGWRKPKENEDCVCVESYDLDCIDIVNNPKTKQPEYVYLCHENKYDPNVKPQLWFFIVDKQVN